jgi:hypothetical protein
MKSTTTIPILIAIPIMIFGTIVWSPVRSQDLETPASGRTPSSEGAVVEFRELKDGDIVPTVFTVEFRISGMGVAPAGSNIENTGHHHLLINVDELPDMGLPLPKSDQIRHFGGGEMQAELTLSAGDYTLQLLFADYAHIPHDPVVMSELITITVSENPPVKAVTEEGDGD